MIIVKQNSYTVGVNHEVKEELPSHVDGKHVWSGRDGIS